MLNRVMGQLQQHGWAGAGPDEATSIFFTRGAALWLLLSRRGEPHTHVKFSDRACLCAEAALCAAAHASYPSLAPPYLGHVHEEGLDLLVCRAVNAVALDPDRLRDGGTAMQAAANGLQHYFAAMPAAQLPAGAVAPDAQALLADMRRYYADHPLASVALPWLDDGMARRLASLPPMPQHGDLVLNNLGLHGHRLVIFDWEDFGAVGVPGLDLYTLLLSLWPGFGRGEGADCNRLTAGHGELVARACTGMGLPRDDFTALMPFHALAFRYLKRNYGAQVRDRMDQVITRLPTRTAA